MNIIQKDGILGYDDMSSSLARNTDSLGTMRRWQAGPGVLERESTEQEVDLRDATGYRYLNISDDKPRCIHNVLGNCGRSRSFISEGRREAGSLNHQP